MSSNPWSHLQGPKRLKRWRSASKLSQTAAAARIGIDAAKYCAFECARKRPGLDTAVEIERATDGLVTVAQWAERRRAA